MDSRFDISERRVGVDRYLTELALYAKELCPEADIEMTPLPYEDEDGHVEVFTPTSFSETEVDQLELALAARTADIFADTGLYIVCAVLDRTAR